MSASLDAAPPKVRMAAPDYWPNHTPFFMKDGVPSYKLTDDLSRVRTLEILPEDVARFRELGFKICASASP